MTLHVTLSLKLATSSPKIGYTEGSLYVMHVLEADMIYRPRKR